MNRQHPADLGAAAGDGQAQGFHLICDTIILSTAPHKSGAENFSPAAKAAGFGVRRIPPLSPAVDASKAAATAALQSGLPPEAAGRGFRPPSFGAQY